MLELGCIEPGIRMMQLDYYSLGKAELAGKKYGMFHVRPKGPIHHEHANY